MTKDNKCKEEGCTSEHGKGDKAQYYPGGAKHYED